MNKTLNLPDPNKLNKTLAKSRQSCADMELAGLELQEVIEKLEQMKREQKIARLKQLSVISHQ